MPLATGALLIHEEKHLIIQSDNLIEWQNVSVMVFFEGLRSALTMA